MSARTLFLTLAIALLAPSAVSAAPFAALTSPVDNECIGSSSHPVKGTASWTSTTFNEQPPSHWDYTLKRGDTGQVLQTRSYIAPVHGGTLTGIDTTTLPTGISFLEELSVYEHDSNSTATAQRSFFPQFDRTKPTVPSVTGAYAVSGRQVWLEWTPSADQGCSGGVAGYDALVQYSDGSYGLAASTPANVDTNAVSNGPNHEAITFKDIGLVPSQSYAFKARSLDRVGNYSSLSNPVTVTMADTYNTVVAGQVKGLSNGTVKRLSGIKVTATAVPPTFGAPVTTMTDANGWYRLSINQGEGTWDVQYGPGCTFLPPPWCSTGWAVSTDRLQMPVEVGLIMPHHKTLQPAG
jgi:hypothetical protein